MRLLILGLLFGVPLIAQTVSPPPGAGGGGGGSGTVNTGAAGCLAYYPSSATTVDDIQSTVCRLMWNGTDHTLEGYDSSAVLTFSWDTDTGVIQTFGTPSESLLSCLGGAPSTPASNVLAFYCLSDKLFAKNDGGTVFELPKTGGLNTKFTVHDTGGDDTYAASPTDGSCPAALVDGETTVELVVDTTNTGTASLNFCGLGALEISEDASGTDLSDGVLVVGRVYHLVYDDQATDVWRITLPGTGGGGGATSYFPELDCIDNSTGWSDYGTALTITALTDSAGANCGVHTSISSAANDGGLRGRTWAASGTFSKRFAVTFKHFMGDNAEFGVMIRDSAGKAVTCHLRLAAGSNRIYWVADQFSNSSTDAGDETINSIWTIDSAQYFVRSGAISSSPAAPWYSPNVFGYFLLASNGTTETCSWSFDGKSYKPIWSSTYLATVDGVGYSTRANSANADIVISGAD